MSKRSNKRLLGGVLCVLWLANLLHAGETRAQESAIEVASQKAAVQLPGEVKNVSVVDGQLYCYASEVLLVAQRSGGQLMGFAADTEFVKLAENITYAVRRPGSDELYFTCLDKRGRSWLYCSSLNKKGHYKKARKVDIGGMEVEHPAFSDDGQMLVYSAKSEGRGLGGYDLWYAVGENGKWSHPRNLGDRINTAYDEISPTMYGAFLLFASNGHEREHTQSDLYASRLKANATGDTVGEALIGRSRVQRLPAPINREAADDFDIAVDAKNRCGYWVSRRLGSIADTQLYTFFGELDGVHLWGRVADGQGRALQSVKVVVQQGGKTVCSATTGGDGMYQLYLFSGQRYDLMFQKDGYFTEAASVVLQRNESGNLVAERRHDAVLGGLEQGKNIYYEDLYGVGADYELTQVGREKLAPLVRYLTDNPRTRVRMSLVSDLTHDATFNLMLTTKRLQALEEYLYASLPSTVVMEFTNGCGGNEGCRSGSGEVVLTVVLEAGTEK